ncbi:AN13C protein, partial [Acromyrmex heyeri]
MPMIMAQENEEYPLHRCIFQGDVKTLKILIGTHDIAEKDKQGNTPLHLAVMLGRKACVQLLLTHGAPVKVKNLAGWSPLAEAISYGDRITISSLVRKLKQQAREQMEERRPNLVAALHQMGDFYMELKWDFQSWVPLVSRVLPSDICKIHKSGASIRMDTTLVDFNDMRWERGDISFIFNGDQKPSHSLTVLDNKAKLFQRVRYEETELEIEDEVDILMSSDIMVAQMSTKSITFSRAQTGWIFREDKRVSTFLLRKRREHLSEEDLQKNKAIMESLTKGSSQGFKNGEPPVRRASLNPPPKSNITWDEYVVAPPGQCPLLGRNLVYKESSKSFKATVAMSPDFPLTVDMLLNVLEVITPFKHLSKLRQFVLMKLPPGFPVKIDIPILPTVTAKITFQEFAFRNDIDPELFQVPSDYFEDPMSANESPDELKLLTKLSPVNSAQNVYPDNTRNQGDLVESASDRNNFLYHRYGYYGNYPGYSGYGGYGGYRGYGGYGDYGRGYYPGSYGGYGGYGNYGVGGYDNLGYGRDYGRYDGYDNYGYGGNTYGTYGSTYAARSPYSPYSYRSDSYGTSLSNPSGYRGYS